ncbi:hypothetical protein [Corynebacterium halotolerans]|uniref:hypothetical protein n=1 Tax=Corynebacterium halotolerans TaxID=225326 RepID=UPI003CE821A7
MGSTGPAPGPDGQWAQWQAVSPVQPPKGPSTLLIVGVIVAAALLCVAVAGLGWYQNWFGLRSLGDGGADTTASVTTPASDPAEEEVPADAERPEFPVLPGGAVAANESARDAAPAGDFNNVYVGTTVTSEPFAREVREAYARQFLDTGSFDASLRVTSPVTGETYTMNCHDNGEFVTCSGGNNAVVYIS